MNNEKSIGELLAFDPLQAAEDRLGDRAYDREEVGLWGLAIAVNHSKEKRMRLLERGDTILCNALERYISIVESLGFEKVLQLPFASSWGYDETYFIYVHRELGILLKFDTYDSTSVNSSNFLYCIKLNDNAVGRVTSSGGFRSYDSPDRYWAGSHDGREALVYHIEQLIANGTFLQKWPEDHGHFLWLLHYDDSKQEGYDYKAITKERIAMLPEWVQEQFSMHSGR